MHSWHLQAGWPTDNACSLRSIYRPGGDRPAVRNVRIICHLQVGWPTDRAFFQFPISNLESGPRGIYRLGG